MSLGIRLAARCERCKWLLIAVTRLSYVQSHEYLRDVLIMGIRTSDTTMADLRKR